MFLRMMDSFFDCLNVRNNVQGKLKRKDFCLPYSTPQDERFKVCDDDIVYISF